MSIPQKELLMHPLVLLSALDHYSRSAKDSNRRVIGILLGEETKSTVNITNSFAIPFEEDPKDLKVWFSDSLYLENFAYMFKKINTKERFVGWYSSGHCIGSNDLTIHECMKKFHADPIFALIDVRKKDLHLASNTPPYKLYISTQLPSSNRLFTKNFKLLSSSIHSSEAEAVAVEHLVRDVKDTQKEDFTGHLFGHIGAIKSYADHLVTIKKYLDDIASKKLPPNQQILSLCQEVLFTLPDFEKKELHSAFEDNRLEGELMLYLGALTSGVISLDTLLQNRRRISTPAKS